MPFGLKNAPGVFQDLMHEALPQMKLKPNIRKLLEQGCVASAFCGNLGNHLKNKEEQFYVTEAFFYK